MKHLLLVLVLALLAFTACDTQVQCSPEQCEFDGECVDEMAVADDRICLDGELVNLPSAPDSP